MIKQRRPNGVFYNTPFQKRFKSLLDNCGISCMVLADFTGLYAESIYAYAAGDRMPTVDSLMSLADHFNVSIDYLLGRSDIKGVR